MEKVIARLQRMSLSQLRALWVLAKSRDGMVEAEETAAVLKLTGKALGGVFSSLARQKMNGEGLVIAWGRSMGGRGLRWKLNTKVISQSELLKITKQILGK